MIFADNGDCNIYYTPGLTEKKLTEEEKQIQKINADIKMSKENFKAVQNELLYNKNQLENIFGNDF